MYDVVILGAGPAGLTAAIYCARYRMKTLIVSQNIGGWVNNAYIVENLPSRTSVPGVDIVKTYKEHIKNNEIDFKKETLENISKEDEGFVIKTNKDEHKARYIIYALGTKKRMLNVSGEGTYLGKGIHTCATCDAPFYRDQKVMVIGGNDSGAKTAMLLSEYASKIYLVELMEKLPMEPMWKEKMEQDPKVEIITGKSAKEFKGEEKLTKVVMTDDSEIEVTGAFIEIGADPNIVVVKDFGIGLDKWNCVEVDSSQQTNVKNFYAAGDVTNGSNYLRQIATAQSEGAVAANAIYKKFLQS